MSLTQPFLWVGSKCRLRRRLFFTSIRHTNAKEVKIIKQAGQATTRGDLVAACLDLKASFVLSCYDGDIYAPLRDIATRQTFKASSSVCHAKHGRVDRVETVYIKNNRQPLLF